MDLHSRAPKKNTSHGKEVLLQDTTHLIQRPCYQRGSPCQDPAGTTRTTRRPPDSRKETQTAMVWSCLLFIRSGQNHLARHSERGKRQGRQRKKWEDNIREWTGLEFTKSQRAVEDREKWRKLVAKSSVVPQRPSRLRDGCEMRDEMITKNKGKKTRITMTLSRPEICTKHTQMQSPTGQKPHFRLNQQQRPKPDRKVKNN